jgi:hypothetical protein
VTEKWTEGVSLFCNAGPEDGIDYYDIWHNGGPGGPMLVACHENSARAICAAIEELHQLRAEVEYLRGERAAVVAWLREMSERRFPRDEREQGIVFQLAHEIERGEHCREEGA